MNFGPLTQLLSVAWVIVALLIGIAAAVGLGAWMLRGGRKAGPRIPQTGVEIVEGRPGAGKSFYGVGLVLKSILEDRRPVYTNLPLRWRAFRHFVRRRGGEELARLVYSIDKEHFERFLHRTSQRARALEGVKARRASWDRRAVELELTGCGGDAARLRRLAVRWFSAARIDRAFDLAVGPAVYSGVGANAIHATAVVVLDELHKWYAQEEQKADRPELRGYLTMHRHQLHRVICITQDWMQLSIAFRRQCGFYWHVRDRGEDQIAFGLRLKHLGIRALGYAKYTPEQEEALKAEDKEPSEQMTVFHLAPWHRWKFRLYDSFTHAGGRRGLMRSLSAARVSAGLQADGLSPEERIIMEAREESRAEGRRPWSRIRRWSGRAFVLFLVVIAFRVGRDVHTSKASKSSAVAAAKASGVPAAPPAAAIKWGKFSGIGKGFVRVDGKRYAVGSMLPMGAEVRAVDMRGRRVVLAFAGRWWLWSYGSDRPSILGDPAKIAADLASAVAARRDGRTISDVRAADGGGVEPPPGVRPR